MTQETFATECPNVMANKIVTGIHVAMILLLTVVGIMALPTPVQLSSGNGVTADKARGASSGVL